MCACRAHYDSAQKCTCGCGDHYYLRQRQAGNTNMATTTTTSAGVVTRTVLFGNDMRVERVYQSGDTRPHILTEGELDAARLSFQEPDGPTEAEVAEAIESIKRAMPDD